MKTKSIKDAVHGYIHLEEPYWRVIDTAQFQRLKWLEQTSYRVLYPSARHDRFIHSIGTYYLGQKAFEGFSKNCIRLSHDQDVLNYKDSFLLACLLHDVGHAPFSHSCEDLYNYHGKVSNINSKLNKELVDLVTEYFEEELAKAFILDYKYIITATDGICKAPSEHEIMSAILTINNFVEFSKGFLDNELGIPSLDLVIRAILGCVYGVTRNSTTDERSKKVLKIV